MSRSAGGSRGRNPFSRLVRTRRDRWLVGTGAVALAVILAVGGVLLLESGHSGIRVTAYFSETIGVYPGSTVRVLGVPVGTVDAAQPDGSRVKVTMTVNSGVAVPAGADAVVIAPSVVADRYIQLTPAYTGGPRLTGGAVIPASRTAVPVEVDQIYASLAKLASSLGPNGANKSGALSNLIKTGATNLAGNGGYLHQMLTEFGGLSRTLGGSAGNLFATVGYLQQFTSMLKNNNGQVKLAEQQLAEVAGFLAGERQDLSATVSDLATALGQVKTFIGSNRGLLTANVNKLAAITSILARERASLAQALDVAPLAADNLVNAYNSATRTLTGRGDLNELSLTGTDTGTGAATTSASTTGASTTATQPDLNGPPAGSVPVPPDELRGLPPLPLPTVGTVYGTPRALLREAGR